MMNICPYCGGENLEKLGNDRYRCLNCGKILFNPKTKESNHNNDKDDDYKGFSIGYSSDSSNSNYSSDSNYIVELEELIAIDDYNIEAGIYDE